MSDKPYRWVDGDPCWPGPYRHSGTLTYTFGLRTRDHGALQKTVQEAIGDDYVASEWILFQLMCCDRATSLTTDLGQLATHDFGISIPVKLRRGTSPLTKVLLYSPYVFADHPAAVVVGREALGFSKQMAVLGSEPPLSMLTKPPRSLLRSLGIDVTAAHRHGDVAGPCRVVDINLSGHGELDQWERIDPSSGLTGALVGLLKTLLGIAGQDFPSFSSVVLRQLRDIAQPEKVCFQQVCEVPMGIVGAVDWRVLSFSDNHSAEYTLTLNDHASIKEIGRAHV